MSIVGNTTKKLNIGNKLWNTIVFGNHHGSSSNKVFAYYTNDIGRDGGAISYVLVSTITHNQVCCQWSKSIPSNHVVDVHATQVHNIYNITQDICVLTNDYAKIPSSWTNL